MNNETMAKFTAMVAGIATLNGVDAGIVSSTRFTVTPSVQQTLENRVQESSDFLSRINFVPVDEMQGQKIGLGIGSPVASRTDTGSGARRNAIDPTVMDAFGYVCKQTNFDTKLTYSQLDMWAKYPDFETRIRDQILNRVALDRILIGFNGTSAAANTDKTVNTNLQDVNIGWLQKMRTENDPRTWDAIPGGKLANKVTYGAAGDFATLDSLVYNAYQSLLATWARDDTALVAIVSSDLLHDKYGQIVDRIDDPSEQLARDVIMSSKRLGGLPAVRVPGMPAGKVLVTRLDNLSLYYQSGKRRRMLKDEPEYDRVVDYQSSNEAYVVEDYSYACLIENIQEKNV